MEPRTHEQRPGTSQSSFDEDLGRRFSNLTNWPGMSTEGFHNEGQIKSSGVQSTAAELFYEPQPPKQQQTPRPLQCIKFMFTRFPWRDMSYLTGVLFAIGSAFFIVNGFFLVLPLTNPSTVFAGQALWTGATAVIGGVIFIFGGFAAILEALNAKRGGSEDVIDGITIDSNSLDFDFKNSEANSTRQLRIHNKLVAPFADSATDIPLRQTITFTQPNPLSTATTIQRPAFYGSPTFIFLPSSFYFRDLSFIASLIQSVGTFIFMFAIITAFPLVLDLTIRFNSWVLNLFPATLGGVLFITASVLQTISTQEKWYIPKPKSVEWHVGFWNVIGSIGFMLAGALFYPGTTEWGLQGSLASLWGSFAFMIGGMLQWYVAMGNCRS
ncbi:hypothetical protein VTL71DRAFT_6560 [Oculimacula yallundae]|uniref:Integral membrane protein n=1 Tax=Oculimacula yallundae TaxID=86028 RepID=A0ABR4BX98_9HELO